MNFLPSFDRRKSELQQELDAHIQMAIADRIAGGEDPQEARAAALREMGNALLIADVTRSQWGWTAFERLIQDLRYAVRQLIKTPGYTVTAILTLTLAIGANTAIFNMLYGIMLRSLPVEHPEQIVQLKLEMKGPSGSAGDPSDYVSGKTYDVLQQHQTVLSGMCGWSNWPLNIHEASGTHPIPTAALTGDCFRTLGLHAALGRLFDERDDKHGGGSEGYAVVLDYNYWRTQLGADPAILGRILDFQDKKGIIVGVLQPGFESVTVGDRPSLYVPSEIAPPEDRHASGAVNRIVLGRLKPHVTPAQVQAQFDPIFQAWQKTEEHKTQFIVFDENGKRTNFSEVHLIAAPGRTGTSYLREQFSRPLYIIEALVALCLLVACAYLATLAGTRALVRRREIAVRMALGASRMRIISQLTCENLLVSIAGAALGLVFAWAGGRLLAYMITLSPWANGAALNAALGGPVLLFSIAITGLTVLLSGIGPAWRASHLDPICEIKEGDLLSGSRRHRRLSAWLVPLQIGISLIVVFVAALMGSTVYRLLSVNPGFRTSGVTFVRADFSQREHASHSQVSLSRSLLERIGHAPGVQNVSIAQAHQFSGAMYMRSATATLPSGEVRKGDMVLNLTVAPAYFDIMGIPLLAGRDFTPGDKEGAPDVCILSRSAAQFFFPGQNAVGQFIDMGMGRKKQSHIQVIGTVGDTLYIGLRGNAPQLIYQPYFAAPWNPMPEFVVRSSDTAAAIAAVRSAVRDLAPDVSLDEPVTISQGIQASMASERLVALLSGFFAVLTLTLTAIGMYGLLNYSAVRRRKEIGVRMALGASRRGVVHLILREGLWMVVPGLVIGAAGSWGAARYVDSLLYEVKPLEPSVCVLSLVVLCAAALLACMAPARRAASVQPMEALRLE